MAFACPLQYLGFWDGVHHHYAQPCGTGQQQPIDAKSLRRHNIDFACPNCTDRITIPDPLFKRQEFQAPRKDELPSLATAELDERGLEEYCPAPSPSREPGQGAIDRGTFKAGIGGRIDAEHSPVLAGQKLFRLLVFKFRDPVLAEKEWTVRIGQEIEKTYQGQKPLQGRFVFEPGGPGGPKHQAVIEFNGEHYYALLKAETGT
jgi:hypothetical protein